MGKVTETAKQKVTETEIPTDLKMEIEMVKDSEIGMGKDLR